MSDYEILPVEPDLLGEGPVWSPEDGALLWVDISGQAVRRHDVATGAGERWAMPSGTGCVALTGGRELLVCLADGVHRLDPADGGLTHVVDPEPELRTEFNDGTCDAAGRFWFGSYDPEEREALGGLYRLDPDGSCTRMTSGLLVSNGIDWSPDGRVLYHVDSGTSTITAYDHDPASGAIERPRVFARDEDCYPYGLTVDAEGGVWNVKWDGWRVVRYDPDGGIDRTVELPVQRPTACAFGGPDLRTLYVTTARFDLDAAALAEQPLAGHVIVLDAGVTGRAPHRFAG